ncbi:uncharacterized protein [Typha angustifolia]|uniref:uncharacterized protein n=1 Tax=Typha angustifolia TaxID=59011 RepID=UPI003C2B18BD
MRGLGIWVFLILVGAALVIISSSKNCIWKSVALDAELIYYSHGVHKVMHIEGAMVLITNRKLKERSRITGASGSARILGSINLEDYPRFDPSPSSKAAIKAGPIEHGTPLMPYVPKAPPPGHPNHGIP